MLSQTGTNVSFDKKGFVKLKFAIYFKEMEGGEREGVSCILLFVFCNGYIRTLLYNDFFLNAYSKQKCLSEVTVYCVTYQCCPPVPTRGYVFMTTTVFVTILRNKRNNFYVRVHKMQSL